MQTSLGANAPEAKGKAARAARDPEAVPLEIGFASRLRFLSLAEQEAARAARYGLSLSLALFSLDDRESLRPLLLQDQERCDWEVGNRLAGVIRQGPDFLARFALGDWAMLLPHTGLDGAVAVAERCLQRVIEQEMRIGAESIRLSIAAGVASHDPVRRYGVETVSKLLQAAERAQRESSALGGSRAVGCAVGSTGAAGFAE